MSPNPSEGRRANPGHFGAASRSLTGPHRHSGREQTRRLTARRHRHPWVARLDPRPHRGPLAAPLRQRDGARRSPGRLGARARPRQGRPPSPALIAVELLAPRRPRRRAWATCSDAPGAPVALDRRAARAAEGWGRCGGGRPRRRGEVARVRATRWRANQRAPEGHHGGEGVGTGERRRPSAWENQARHASGIPLPPGNRVPSARSMARHRSSTSTTSGSPSWGRRPRRARREGPAPPPQRRGLPRVQAAGGAPGLRARGVPALPRHRPARSGG